MSKKQINVAFRVTSYEGDSEFNLPSSEAFAKIKELADNQNKWIYINNQVKNTELLTEQDLIEATTEGKPIMLMNALAGGDIPKIIDIEFSVGKKTKKAVSIDFEETKHAKIISVSLNDELASDVIRNRDTIVRVLKKKFDELANELYNKKYNELDEAKEEAEQELEDFINELDEELYDFGDEINY